MSATFPCPCCGYLVFNDPVGSDDICPICFWEDDGFQLEFATTHDGGPNNVTLLEAQRNFARFGACREDMVKHVRTPTANDHRDPAWRPIDPDQDTFEDWNVDQPVRAPDDADVYYWRPTFWRRGGRRGPTFDP